MEIRQIAYKMQCDHVVELDIAVAESGQMTYKIILIDDHDIVREGLTTILSATDEFKVVGSYSGISEALTSSQLTDCDLIISDICIPGEDVFQLVADADKSRKSKLNIMYITAYVSETNISRVTRSQSCGLLEKTAAPQVLLEGIRKACHGEVFYTPRVAHLIALGTQPTFIFERLSRREVEIFTLLAEGLTIATVAKKLFISPKTVEKHKYTLMQKLELPNMQALVRYAVREGVVAP
ncbi:MAG: LuxR C-terminal-related transcriptional regulator [Oligoflexales bacterium]